MVKIIKSKTDNQSILLRIKEKNYNLNRAVGINGRLKVIIT